MMKPKPPDILAHNAEMTLRKAYAPDATPEEKGRGGLVARKAISLIVSAAKENEDWLIMQLRSIGAGKFVATIIARLLRLV